MPDSQDNTTDTETTTDNAANVGNAAGASDATTGEQSSSSTNSDTQSEPVAKGATENDAGNAASTPVNAVSDVEETFFIVSSKPANGTFTDLDEATKAADDMASLHPGLEIYVLEARVSAISPAPTVKNTDLPQK